MMEEVFIFPILDMAMKIEKLQESCVYTYSLWFLIFRI